MDLEINDKTRKFVRQVKVLQERGVIKTQVQLAEDLDWSDTMLSNVLKFRKNVPDFVFRKFTELYPPTEEDMDYRERLIDTQAQQAQDLRESLLHERARSKTTEGLLLEQGKKIIALEQALDAAMKNQRVIHASLVAYLEHFLERTSALDGYSLEEARKKVGQRAAALLKKPLPVDIEIG
jgi:hypothetical protein